MNGNKWLYSLIGFMFFLIAGSYGYTYQSKHETLEKYDKIIDALSDIELSIYSNSINVKNINKILDKICETVIKNGK